MKCFIIVLDSVGIGEAPDAADYGDSGASTLAHIAQAVGGLSLPVLQKMGMGNIPAITRGIAIEGLAPCSAPIASYGAMQEVSRGKDTTTGHWEMAGIELKAGFHIFKSDPPSFPEELVHEFELRTGRKILGNKAASGIAIIDELGERQMKEGSWIVYTSADSVFQIAAHEEIIPLKELYSACAIARELCNPYKVGRVIARPYLGKPGAFKRTENRRDFSCRMPDNTIFHRLYDAGIPAITVGKLDDIFTGAPLSKSIHMENNRDAQKTLLAIASEHGDGLVFANLIDFDMLYGHRRDVTGYAVALADTDRFMEQLLPKLKNGDLLIITADHGNDPTYKGSDHTREFVPLLSFQPLVTGRSLGIRKGFYDIAQSVASFFATAPLPYGQSFLGNNSIS
ncbi:MAG: phosphopentomutase [Kiritimatiellae bacterium]|nr:phosphopentomutase [Kiritimatiellia bacterium]MDD5521230.1 phosphopentomutase [Kiritimatiellia bacterium]